MLLLLILEGLVPSVGLLRGAEHVDFGLDGHCILAGTGCLILAAVVGAIARVLWGQLIPVAAQIEQAAQMIPPTMGALESLGPTTTRLVIGADDVQWLARYLLGFPWDFEVDSPTELSEELTTIGRRLLAVHAP